MIKTIAVCVLVMGVMLQGCDKGCLKCSSSNQCQFCDITNNYYLNGTACATSSLTNCLLLGNSGSCLQCGSNYYLDANTNKCVAVSTTKLVSNCASYSSGSSCNGCAQNFYINSGNCTAVTKLVANCATYSADGTCSTCSTGYVFNANRTSCVANPNTSNCSAYSYITCKSCASGYIANQNYYLAYMQNSVSVLQANLQSYVSGGDSDWTNPPTCQKYQDANCLAASAYNVCTACKSGYFLNSQYGCTAYPLPIISGCQTYNSLTTCSNCQTGYVLTNSTACTPIATAQLIANCTAYNNAVPTVTCTQCVASQYLSGNNCNTARTASASISNCNATTVTADTCASCGAGYSLTTDSLACLPVVANCATYATSSKTDANFTCTSCSNGYYLNGSGNTATCVQGTIAGCLVYSSSSACTSCDSSAYWLNGNTCTAHVKVSQCTTYSTSNFNQCTACNTGYFPFKYTNTCQSVTVIANCVTYNADGTCATCADTYFLKNNACVAYSTLSTNCTAANSAGTACTTCADGSALLANSTCAAIHNYISSTCDTLASSATFKDVSTPDAATCTTCASGTYPFKYDNFLGCVANSLLATKVATTVANCKQYSDDSSPVCLQCATGYYLNIPTSGARTCTAACDATANTNIPDALDGNINTCQAQAATTYALASCSTAIKVYDTTNSVIASACTKVYGSTIVPAAASLNPADNPTYWKDIGGSTVPSTSGAFLFNGYAVTAYDKSANTNKHTDNANAPCELYFQPTGSSNYNCMRCKWGYAVTITSGQSTCAAITDCNTSVSYSGFSSTINQILSCHGCNNSKVPVVQVSLSSSALTGTIVTFKDSQASVVCQATTTGTHSATTPQAIANCAVYATAYDSTNTNALIGGGCVACQPGYKPHSSAAIFTQCDAISMCDMTKTAMVNRCGGCKQTDSNNAAEYKAYADITLQACFKSTTANCLILASSPTPSSTTTSYNCATCMPGYWLNADSQCEKITLPGCDNTSESTTFFTIPQTWDAPTLATYYALKNLAGVASLTGCNTCSSGFTAVKMPVGEQQCVNSSYVQANSFGSSANYITDCDKYDNDLTTITCKACKNSKILTDDSTKCVTAPTNCILADHTDITKCVQCGGTYAAVNGVCTLKNIANCATYLENVSSMQCSVCNAGYVLATNATTCYKGSISQCLTYDTDKPTKCTTCASGYKLVTLNPTDTTYCFQIDPTSNCSDLDATSSTGLAGGIFSCTACSSSSSAAYAPKAYSTSNTTIAQSVCLALNPIDKCTAYDSAHAAAADNTFACEACSTGYYASSNACVARANQPSACLTYYATADKCQTCDTTTSFKKTDETDCVSFPNGIYQCATYSNSTVCTSCNSPYYLANNTCTLSTVISNCAAYSANYTCTACASGYFLNNSTSCVAATASNCYTYTNASACASCDPTNSNMGLKTDTNGVVNCVAKNVANCAASTNQYPFTCTKCSAGYYLNSTSASCVAVSTTVANCLTYDTATTCTLCQQGYVLNANRTACDGTTFASDVDANCADSEQLSSPACSECNPGSIFVNGTCTSCTNNTYSSGCYSCDPTNQSNCIACRPGYYMTQTGSCVAVSGQTNGTSSSAAITQLFGLLALLFALLF